jgi:hypothetical protein
MLIGLYSSVVAIWTCHAELCGSTIVTWAGGSHAGLGQVLVVYSLSGWWNGVLLGDLCTEWVEYVKDAVF